MNPKQSLLETIMEHVAELTTGGITITSYTMAGGDRRTVVAIHVDTEAEVDELGAALGCEISELTGPKPDRRSWREAWRRDRDMSVVVSAQLALESSAPAAGGADVVVETVVETGRDVEQAFRDEHSDDETTNEHKKFDGEP